MELPKISFVVPIYGTEKYIARCCASLFGQNYSNIEFIFVNDCTKDDAVDVLMATLSEYPDRKEQTKVINHEKNLGLGGTRLTGLKHSTGDYVWFVDSDDFVTSNAIEVLKPYFQSDYDLILFSFYETKNGKVVKKKCIQEANIPNILTHKVSPSIWKVLVKRSVLTDNDIYPVVGINYAEDMHLLLRICLASKKTITLNNHFLYHYNVDNENSIMHNVDSKCLMNLADAIDLVYDFYDARGSLKKYLLLFISLTSDCYIKLSKHAALNNRSKDLLCKIRKLSFLSYIVLLIPFPYLFKDYYIRVCRFLGYNLYRFN